MRNVYRLVPSFRVYSRTSNPWSN